MREYGGFAAAYDALPPAGGAALLPRFTLSH